MKNISKPNYRLLDSKNWEAFKETYKSRRGDYRLINTPNPLIWEPEPLGTSKRDLGVMSEIEYAVQSKLAEHPYWQDEPKEFIDDYTSLYQELFGLAWLYNKEDRHSIVANTKCCMTLVQYNNGILHAYSRSTDMRNGYFSDKKVLDYLASYINKYRPDCKVEKIIWYLAIPHEYVEKGIARLKEETNNE